MVIACSSCIMQLAFVHSGTKKAQSVENSDELGEMVRFGHGRL